MRKILLGFISFVSMLSLSVYISGCSDSSSGGSADSSGSSSFAGPGSAWTMTRSGNSYTISMVDGSDSITVQATGETLASGHTKLTVTSATATGSATAPNAGDIAHAREISGTAFLLLPFDNNAETIAMITAGSCPTTDFTANWVIGHRAATAGAKLTKDDADWFGSIIWDTAAGSATFPLYRSVEDFGTNFGDNGAPQTLGTCSNGRVSGTNLEVYFTPSGLAIVATQVDLADESHIIAIPQTTITTASDVYGNYSGFVFDQENDVSVAVTATFAAGTGAAGDLDLQVVSGVDLTTNGATYSVQVANVDNPGAGFMSGEFSACAGGSVQDFDGTCETVCAVSQNVNLTGKNMIYCVGQHPSDEDDRMTILLMED